MRQRCSPPCNNNITLADLRYGDGFAESRPKRPEHPLLFNHAVRQIFDVVLSLSKPSAAELFYDLSYGGMIVAHCYKIAGGVGTHDRVYFCRWGAILGL